MGLMREIEKVGAWLDFLEGRVSHTGVAKWRDELPIETFAVELEDGQIYYGQMDDSFLPNGNDYNLEVVSFGWPKREWLGSVPVAAQCAVFNEDQLLTVQTLICQAVKVWWTFKSRPFFLTESRRAHFQGDVLFRNGWALVYA